jgi:hypothetical protein
MELVAEGNQAQPWEAALVEPQSMIPLVAERKKLKPRSSFRKGENELVGEKLEEEVLTSPPFEFQFIDILAQSLDSSLHAPFL